MQNLKLRFDEKETKEKQHGQKMSLTFKGHWANDKNNPEVTFRVSKCEDSDAETILADLGIVAPGEFLFLNQGENPQERLDQYFKKVERQRSPKVADFEKEIADHDVDLLRARQNTLYQRLVDLIKDNKEGTKKFDFFLDCYNLVRERLTGYADPVSKEDLISNVRSLDLTEVDESDDWQETDWDEEE